MATQPGEEHCNIRQPARHKSSMPAPSARASLSARRRSRRRAMGGAKRNGAARHRAAALHGHVVAIRFNQGASPQWPLIAYTS